MVSYLGVDNSARTMTGTLSVNGLSFSQSDATPTARVDFVVCATAAWSSATTVNCVVTTAPTLISTDVTVGMLVGTRYPAFTFDGWLL